MYFRYFMWNFSGRQNDVQSHYKEEITKGNWLSGVKFVDEAHLGDQSMLPENLKNNKARNTYYLLPFLLGLIGLIYQFSKNRKDFWIVMSLFVLTGIAIVFYLNQYPHQPRERDYAYAGSFYAFAIWIGLAVLAIYEGFKKTDKNKEKKTIVTIGGIVLGFMALEFISRQQLSFTLALLFMGALGFLLFAILKALGKLIPGNICNTNEY